MSDVQRQSEDAKTARRIARQIATEHFGKEPIIAFPFENLCQKLIHTALTTVRAEERERCAKVADDHAKRYLDVKNEYIKNRRIDVEDSAQEQINTAQAIASNIRGSDESI
jgi:hypothetical protein